MKTIVSKTAAALPIVVAILTTEHEGRMGRSRKTTDAYFVATSKDEVDQMLADYYGIEDVDAAKEKMSYQWSSLMYITSQGDE
jgi:hypothetical protein